MNARDVARRVLSRVERGAFATLALSGEIDQARLQEPDRSLAAELVYGTLRWRLRIDYALAACAPRGIDRLGAPVLDALRLAAYQLLFLRVAPHAAVDDAVGAVKRIRGERLAGFCNAILRRLAREGEPPPPSEGDPIAHLSIVGSAPRWFVERVVSALGATEARDLLDAINRPPPVWLRVNLDRSDRESVARAIVAERPRAELIPSSLLPEALAVRHGGELSRSGPFARGEATAQDLAAQLIAHLVDPRPGERLLDACAGVGGKSTHLASLAGATATIDAADTSARKLELAADTARRLGIGNVRAHVLDLTALEPPPAGPLASDYDRVLLDAPCSGLGVVRRHPEAKWRVEPKVIDELAALQRRLLDALAPRVRSGGVFVYSVCSFTDEEGPRQIAEFLERNSDFRIDEPPERLRSVAAPDGALRTWPHRDDADAFYAIRLRRR